MAKNEKSFNIRLYAVISFIAVAFILAALCVVTFKAKYIAFHPEELARSYADTIVQTGDGYNAYKNTLVSKNMKYGDFIRKNYITPAVNRDGTDYSADSFKGEKTLSDDGSLSGKVIAEMYPVYESLIKTYGWDDYNSIFTEYIDTLITVREEIFGDKFFNDEVFFSAFEANVSAYGKTLTGTEDVFDENTGVQLSEKTEGIYQKLYGEDYKFICEVLKSEKASAESNVSDEYISVLETYGVKPDEIEDRMTVSVKVSSADNTELVVSEIALVKIGMSWYVDNLNTDTAELYNFYQNDEVQADE